jgi:hypothetical protein
VSRANDEPTSSRLDVRVQWLDVADDGNITGRSMRVIGHRKTGSGDRPGLDALVLKFGGGAKKGVFRYRSQEEANRDWDQWMTERVRRRTRISST